MAYSALTLITRAWYLSGIVARNLEEPSGDQITDGLFLLNSLLEFKSTDMRLIPYFKRYAFTLTAGEEEYFIPNLLEMELFTFTISDVRYSTIPQGRVRYFGSPRANNIQSLPFNWRLEREKGGSRLYIYYLPQDNYPAELSGKFGLTDVTLYQDLDTVYDGFYIEYLRYALADFMCDEYEIMFDPDKKKRLMTYEKKLQDVSPPDLALTKMSCLQSDTGINYADVNLGRGWRP
jgi:hypothetical protein